MASLLGRILRSIFILSAFWAVSLSTPASAAPFAAIVIDARSGEVLYEKNADTRLHPASLTKMMTLYIVFQEIEAGRISLDDKVTISKNAAGQAPSRLGLKAGQKIAVRYLIRAAAVKSANDAAMALGEFVGGGSQEAFAKRMTKTARALGMKNSTFKNPNGLTAEGHLSTARDMTILGRHLFYDFPQFYNIFSRRTADAGMATVHNTNSRFLDSYEGADGIKTGYTVAAGFNLTASAQRGNKRIIATVFGGTSTAARNAKMAELMDLGFGAARNNVREKAPEAAPLPEAALVAEAAPVDTPDVEGGAAKTIRVSGEVIRSLRPKSRPVVQQVPDEVAVAIASSVDDALGEALAAPAPDGTLEAQVEKLADATDPLAEDVAQSIVGDVVEGMAETDLASVTPPEARPEDLAAAAPPPEGTLEAQALALTDVTAEPAPAPALAPPPEGTLDAQALAMADGAAPAQTPPPEDPALAAVRPMPRPETADTAEKAPQEVLLAEAETATGVAADTPADTPAETLAEPAVEAVQIAEAAVSVAEDSLLADAALAEDAPATAPATADVTDVESVAAALMAPMPETAPDAAPARKAPIFETVAPELAVAAAEPPVEELVVVAKSTSGGRHWGVNVGDFTSRSEAERQLLKTALVESATLNQGLRKITEKGGSYHANFMGLTEDQADLACRRLHARGVSCETLGP